MYFVLCLTQYSTVKFNRRRLILNCGSNKQTKMKNKIEWMKINEMQNLDLIPNKSYHDGKDCGVIPKVNYETFP
jgi:hypothetical protein